MISIILLTYNRLELAKRTMMSVRRNLKGEQTRIHIADDGCSQEYRDELLKMAHEPEMWGNNVTVTNSERAGYGGNYNAATQVVHSLPDSDLVLPLEDDWELVRDLDNSPIAKALRVGIKDPVVGPGAFNCVRMGYIGWTKPLTCNFH